MVKKLIYLSACFALLTMVIAGTINAQSTASESVNIKNATANNINQGLKSLVEQQKSNLERERATISARIQEARAKFKEGLTMIKDQVKQRLVQRIDKRIAEINKNKTDRYIKVLDVLQVFVDRTSEISTDSATLTNIASAQIAINAARLTVVAQAEKVYTMDITDEQAIRANAGTVISQFKHDLAAMYRLVIDAKVAVQKLYPKKESVRTQASESAQM